MSDKPFWVGGVDRNSPEYRRLSLADECAAFNRLFPIGSTVWLVDDFGKHIPTRTRSEAWQLGDGSPVVLVEGKTGGWHIERIKTREAAT